MSQEFVVKRPDKASFGKNSSGKYTAREFKTAMAVYSMWSHFLEFNVKLQEKTEQEEEAKRQLQVIQNSFFSYTFPQWSGQQLWSEEQQQLINSTSTGNNLNLKESSTKLIRSSSISANRPPTPRSVLQADWSPFSDESWEESPDPSDEINKHTGRRRLSVFVALSQGFSM